jgi:hypothetical protein
MALVKPKSLKTRNTDIATTSVSKYVEGHDDLSVLTLDELANRYEEINQQSQLFKGLILLEARSRFPSNNEFGDWVQSVPSLCGDGNQVRNRYMNFAKYFKDKERLGISLTAAYEISAPANEAVADRVYEYALNKNLPVAEIKKQIKLIKQELCLVAETPENKESGCKLELLSSEDFALYEKVIIDDVKDISEQNAIRILNSCIKKLRIKMENAKNNEQSIPASEDAGI